MSKPERGNGDTTEEEDNGPEYAECMEWEGRHFTLLDKFNKFVGSTSQLPSCLNPDLLKEITQFRRDLGVAGSGFRNPWCRNQIRGLLIYWMAVLSSFHLEIEEIDLGPLPTLQ